VTDPILTLALETEPKPADINTVVVGLTRFNASQASGETPQYLLVSVRNAEGTMVGGLFAATWLGWLAVQAVWLPDDLRGRGHGSTLLELAEKEGLRRGCKQAFLETLSFQALPFYEKRGYTIFSQLKDFPPGGTRYALTKRLDTNA
jgi:GNAT superfamily N-acetyltransferase